MTSFITGANITGFLVGATNNGPANNYTYDRFAALYKNGDASEWQTLSSMQLWAIYNGISPTSIDTEINSQASLPSNVLSIGVPFQSTCYHDSSNNLYLYINGAQGPAGSVGTVNLAPDNLILGAGQTSASGIGAYLTGTISELIIYNSALTTANRQTVERNQMSYHAVPLPIAYVSKWYDQSGNGNDLTQTIPLLQPSLMMPAYGSNTSYPTVMFNGGQFLSSSTGMVSNADCSEAVVFSYFDSTKSNDIIGATSNNTHDLYMGGTGGTPSNALRITARNASGAADAIVTSSLTMNTNTNYAIASTWTQTTPSRTFTLYRSNSSGGSASTGNSNSDTSIELGAYNARFGETNYGFLNGAVSEAMIFARSLNSTDQTLIYTDEQNNFSSQ